MLSKVEKEFLKAVQNGTVDKRYSPEYRRVLKHKVLKKRKQLTQDALLINALLDEIEAL